MTWTLVKKIPQIFRFSLSTPLSHLKTLWDLQSECFAKTQALNIGVNLRQTVTSVGSVGLGPSKNLSGYGVCSQIDEIVEGRCVSNRRGINSASDGRPV